MVQEREKDWRSARRRWRDQEAWEGEPAPYRPRRGKRIKSAHQRAEVYLLAILSRPENATYNLLDGGIDLSEMAIASLTILGVQEELG